MGRITLQQAAEWCGGRIDTKYKDITFFGANNDTRKLQPGQLFVALQGVRDGHDFIPAALEKGAAAVLCTHCDGDYPAIVVEDTRIALGNIARGARQQRELKVVGITGSVGKSTTKEMTATVLGSTYRVSKTPVNHNNDIGMPMAILAMPDDTQIAVLEMGMNHFGEISYLSNIAKPDVAVIINVGTMHVENLGSRQGILQAKLEILEGVSRQGVVCLNGDNDMLQSCDPGRPVTWFGTGAHCAVRGEHVREGEAGLSFDVVAGEETFSVTLPLEGLHYVSDALAAVAVGLSLGVPPQQIRLRLANFQNMAGRQEIFTAKECTIIQDCYNAGPESMAAALAVLGKRSGRRIAVLGDMLELGDHAHNSHLRVGALAAEHADLILAYGPHAALVVQGAEEAGNPNAIAFHDRKEMADTLKELTVPGDTLLFKGSHGMHMELVLQQFLTEETNREE